MRSAIVLSSTVEWTHMKLNIKKGKTVISVGKKSLEPHEDPQEPCQKSG